MKSTLFLGLRYDAIVCVWIVVTVLSRAADRPITVCEALTNLDVYRGKTVAVRAVLLGWYHGEFLKDREGDEPCNGEEKGIFVAARQSR
jgi:hypothetical protein